MRGKDLGAVKNLVKSKVRMASLLSDIGVSTYGDKETQISCPFHGQDSSPSARFYPDTDSIHCFTCKETWDVISFEMGRQGITFRDTLEYLVTKYRLNTLSLPDSKKKWTTGAKEDKVEPTVDKQALLLIRLEESIKKRINHVPIEKYATWVYLLAGIRKLDEGKKFMKIAASLVRSIKKVNV